ncbi:SLC31A1 family protein [Megaselia abdita]
MDHNHDHSAHHDHSHHMQQLSSTSDVSSTNAPPVDHSMHHGHGGGTGNMMEHMMSMAFHFGYNETILFSSWTISSVGGLIGSMVAIFLMATLYEGLKYYREYLFWKTYNLLEYRPVCAPPPDRTVEEQRSGTSAPTVQYIGEVIHKKPPTMISWNHLYQTVLHIIQVTLSFLLMLIFMTYNVWLCLAVVLGAAVGYFLFCWKKSVIVDVTEHCH